MTDNYYENYMDTKQFKIYLYLKIPKKNILKTIIMFSINLLPKNIDLLKNKLKINYFILDSNKRFYYQHFSKNYFYKSAVWQNNLFLFFILENKKNVPMSILYL